MPLLDAIFGFFLGLLCACKNFWNVFFGPTTFTCQDMSWCNDKRRAVMDVFQVLVGTQPQWMYQMFAPDWPLLNSYAFALLLFIIPFYPSLLFIG